MKQWLLGVILTAFAGGLARQLAPGGREQAMVRLVSGLLLTLAVLRPLGTIQGVGLPEGILDPAEQEEAYRKTNEERFAAVIAERAQAYILDKADRLGLACEVEVTVEAQGEGGVPLPVSAVIRGGYSEALAACIEEVGIPAGKQIWLEERTWRMEN